MLKTLEGVGRVGLSSWISGIPHRTASLNLIIAVRLVLMAVILPLAMVAINVGSYVSASAPSVIISITPEDSNIGAGSEFTVKVKADTVTDLDTFVLYVSYDPAVIRVKGTEGGTGVVKGQITDDSVTPSVVKSIPITWRFEPAGTQGIIKVSGDLNAAVLQGANGSGTLALITFQVIGAYGAISQITPSNVEMMQTRSIPLIVLRYNSAKETVPYPPVTVSISAPSSVPAGDELNAKVNISLVADLNAFQFDIVYDPTVLQIKGEEGGTEGVTGGLIGASQIPISVWLYYPTGIPGIVRVIGAVENAVPVTGSGYLAEIHFDVIGEPQENSGLLFVDHDVFQKNLFNSGGAIAGVTWTGATVNVISSYRITTASPLPSGEVGRPYSKTLVAVGGATPYSFSILAGTLPDGLHLSTSGSITGTPTTVTTSNSITFKVRDNTGAIASKALSIAIVAPPEISTVSPLPNGEVGMAYSRTMTAINGLSPYTWSKAAGNLPPGLTISSTGILSGNPTTAGTSNFILQIVDNVGGTALKAFTITIVPNPTIATASPLPNGEVNINYSITLTSSGGISPFSYSLLSGTLPSGITLSSNGMLSGKTLTAGTSNFSVKTTDSLGGTGSKAFSLTIATAPVITTSSTLQKGELNAVYSQSLAVSGGVPPFTFIQTGGTIPAGLSLSAGGTIGGTPTTTGTTNFSVKATDSLGGNTSKNFNITIITGLSITTASELPAADTGIAYSKTLAATGGLAPYSWSKQSGTLPPGLDISTAGVISGTPTTVGNYVFVIQAIDSLGGLAARSFTINVAEGPVITTESPLPDGEIKIAYSQTLTVNGGVAPYTWSKQAGTLPTGLSFSGGTLSGTPTTAIGPVSITFKVTDSLGVSTTKVLTITIVGSPVISTTSPLPGGEVGLLYSRNLAATGGVPPFTWTIQTGTLPAGLSLNTNGTISGTPTTAGTSNITLRVTDSLGASITKSFTLTIVAIPAITTAAPLPDGGINAVYNQVLAATGGITPYTWTIQTGTLPAGLSLNANGTISGTATVLGKSNFTIKVADSLGGIATRAFSITIVSGPAISTESPLPDGEKSIAYSQTLAVSGGVAPYTWTKQSGTLPSGLSISAAGKISGTPAANGTTTATIKVTDSLGGSSVKDFSITIAAVPVISTSSPLPNGEINLYYSQELNVTGGIEPYTWSKQSGTLPAGLDLSSDGIISGTPTAVGTSSVTVKLTDSLGGTTTKVFSITIVNVPIISANSPLTTGEVNYAYSQALTATGGVTPYAWTVQAGTLPSGLTLSGAGIISGTPTVAGTRNITIQLTDNLGGSATKDFSITIATAPVISTDSPLPDGEIRIVYSKTLTVNGGFGPYTWTKQAGTLPAGLNLSAAGTVTGTPTTAGTSSVTVKVTDGLGGSAIKVLSITIAAAPAISTASPLTAGEISLNYSQNLAVTGGIGPYTWTKQSGTLPSGLNLSADGTISGTPTAAGTSSATIKVTDSLGGSATKVFSITIVTVPVISTNSPLASGEVNDSYTQILGATGGVTPYTWVVQAGTLPAGLNLSTGGTISGTPTVAGTSSATIQLTDNLGGTSTRVFSIMIAAAPEITTNSPLPDGEINFNYSQTIAVSGGIGPFTWSKQAGNFPSGLSINAAGTINGKPTAAGTSSATVKVIDSLGGVATKVLSITIAPAPVVSTTSPLPNGEVNLPYSGSLLVTGGVAPYTWTIQSGTLPPGLNISAGGIMSGSPTALGTSNFTLKVTDSFGGTATRVFTLTIIAMPAISTNSPLTNGEVNLAYSQVLAATGGATPYTWSLQTGTLPAGLSLSAAGTISGTPTTAGIKNITVKLTDNLGGTATRDFSITIAAVPTISTTSPLTSGEINIAYSQNLTATGGISPYTWTIQTGTLPAGLILSPGGVISGTPTTSGTTSVTIRMTDSLGGIAAKVISIPIVVSPSVSTTSPLPHGDENYAYSQNLAATGGISPYTWTIQTGTLPAGLNLSAGGTISGTPTMVGTSNFTLKVTDSLGGIATRAFTITIAARPFITTNSPLTGGEVSIVYSQNLALSGGVAPYSWTIQTGTLPAGLNLSAGGTISGTPTASGTSNLTIKVTDSWGGSAIKDFSITIAAAPTITTPSPLHGGEVNLAYSQNLAQSGGIAPYTWTIQTGTLPSGLNLSAGGTISGTPTASGTSSLTIKVTDSLGGMDEQDFTLVVANALEISTASPLPSGEINITYTQSLEATGGAMPYVWTIQSGNLPTGLSLSSTGTISGAPTAAGTSSLTLKVTDNLGGSANRVYSIKIAETPTITTGSPLSDGGLTVVYSQVLEATGGITPYTWSKQSGTLPAGLTLNSNGTINGTPTALGTGNFTLKVTDDLGGTATKAFSITIVSGPVITTDSPLPNGEVGLVYSKNLTVAGGSVPYTWTLQSGTLPAGLGLSTAGTISGNPSAAGTSNISIQVVDRLGLQVTKVFSITIADSLGIITNSSLANGEVNIAYLHNIEPSGGIAPYTWTIQTGTLPAGLNLSASGTISGTPTAAGTRNLQMRVTDGLGGMAEKEFSIIILAAPTILTGNQAPDAETGITYSFALTVSGGTSPYKWSASGLPGGLSISEDGVISGTPATAGNYTVITTVHDSFVPSNSVTKNISLNVYARLQILNNTIAAGLKQKAYSEKIIFTGGVPPLVWTADNLPQGLSISSTDGVITGTPVTPGSYQIVVTVTDAHNPAISESKRLTLKVYMPYDANGNGVVDMGDVVKVQRIISGLDPPTIAADANEDGKVNKDDILTIISYILGISS
jgi:large repetitive protein